VFVISVPRAMTLSLHQFVLLALVGFATIMTDGSVSVFQFGFNLQSVPLAIIGVSYSVAAFPLLAQMHAEGKMVAFADHIITALRHVIFWSIPVIALLVVIRAQFVRVVLGTGAFDWDDTRLTAAVLALFVLSLTSQAIHLLIIRALYAVGNTRLPFFVTLFSSVGIITFSFLLYAFFMASEAFRTGIESILRIEGVPGTEVVVLALGYTIILIIHSIVLLVLSQKYLHFNLVHIQMHMVRSVFAALLGGIAAYATLNLFVDGLRTETLAGIFMQGALAGVVGILAVVLGHMLVRSPELTEIYRAFQRKMFKTDVAPPQDEDHLAV
jgi:putative peptidoglycan lipid II flippase